ncbi:MAG: amidohydrolase family protein [Tepidisphaeraceae bacterium]|jgi:hypothetical protein
MTGTVYANHAHVFPPGLNPDGSVARLLKLMDACGIQGAVCFAPFAHQAKEAGIRPNHWLADAIRGEPRLRGFGTVDFAAASMRDQVKETRDLGLVGLKLHPNSQEFDVLCPRAMEAYAAAEEMGLFVTFHTGVHAYRLSHTALWKFDEVAHHFPNLRFSMEHMGGYHYFGEALAVLFNRFPPPWAKDKKCNVFAGLASVFTQHQNRMWYLRPEQILEIILQTSAEQCIFGLDFPYNLERETNMGLETIRTLPIPEEQKGLILGANLRRELHW